MTPLLLDGIIGARPNIMKMAPLARALAEDGTFQLRLIHTGQHYDEQMSGTFLHELDLPQPAFNLEVGSAGHGAQTARILERYEQILLTAGRPCGLIVAGDVNSTMAGALVAAKLGIPVAHVEAGLRSGDRSMPEEINRIVTDALSECLFVSDPAGLFHLAREGHPRERTHLVGNIMIDTLLRELPKIQASSILSKIGLHPRNYVYLTLHRPSNVDHPAILSGLVRLFDQLSTEIPFVFSMHPRTRARLEQSQIELPLSGRFRIVEPLGYYDNLKLIQESMAVLTDSGGIQEEASILNIPCLTLRDNTERPVTVELGSSELVGNEPERICSAWQCLQSGEWKQSQPIPLWDGKTAVRIVDQLRRIWGNPMEKTGRS
jgi:UDP-N-acetylglucosamine 2-epimerase (non-hydrolysing)